MTQPSFRSQYDKIVGAYLRNELNPSLCEACFVGNLLNGKTKWANGRDVSTGKVIQKDLTTYYDLLDKTRVMADIEETKECLLEEAGGLYTQQEVVTLERTFLDVLMEGHWTKYNSKYASGILDPLNTYESRLFRAMEVTLEALKVLHESKGEVVEDYVFNKRQLVS